MGVALQNRAASQDCQCWSHGACPVPTRRGINEEFIICFFQGRKALWWFIRSYVEPLGPIWVLLGQGLLGWWGGCPQLRHSQDHPTPGEPSFRARGVFTPRSRCQQKSNKGRAFAPFL